MITALLWLAPLPAAPHPSAPGLSPRCAPSIESPQVGQGAAVDRTSTEGDGPLGAWSRTLDSILAPTGLAYDVEGRLYVCQGFGESILRFSATGELDPTFRTGPKLYSPAGIVVGPDGRVYVSDSARHGVHVLTTDGAWIETHGAPGSGPGEFHFPSGLALLGTRLAVADSGNHRVQVMDLASGEVTVFGSQPAPLGRSGMARNGALARPSDVAFAPEGHLFVADTSNHRVQVFDPAGVFLRGWGGFGSHAGLFSAPTGIDLVGDRLHVVDRDNHRVQVFGLDGAPLEGFGVHAIRPNEGEGALHDPTAIAVHPSGNGLAIAEPRQDRVQTFGRHSLGESGYPEGAGEIPVPLGGAAPHYGSRGDCAGTLLVMIEPETHRLTCHDTRFALERPIRFARLGDHGSAPLEFKTPVDLALDPRRPRLYVSDRDNHRIQALDLDWDPEAPPGNRLFGFARFASSIDLHAEPGRPPNFDPRDRLGLRGTVEPGALDVDGLGRLYLCDERSGRVLRLGPGWTPLGSFGPEGAGPGRFDRPVDVVVEGTSGRWWVVDAGRARLHAFDRDGRPVRSLDLEPDPQSGVPAEPFSLALPPQGTLWVSDRRSATIRVLDSEGSLRKLLGGPGLGAAEFHRPGDILPREGGGFWVLDPGNHRFQGLDSEGSFLEAYGASLYVEPTQGVR